MLRHIPGRKNTISTPFNKWAVATAHGYLLVASYDLVGGRLYYSASNEEHVTLPAWTLDKMPPLTTSPPALGPSMITMFKEARKRFNVNGTEIDGRKINSNPKINGWHQHQTCN